MKIEILSRVPFVALKSPSLPRRDRPLDFYPRPPWVPSVGIRLSELSYSSKLEYFARTDIEKRKRSWPCLDECLAAHRMTNLLIINFILRIAHIIVNYINIYPVIYCCACRYIIKILFKSQVSSIWEKHSVANIRVRWLVKYLYENRLDTPTRTSISVAENNDNREAPSRALSLFLQAGVFTSKRYDAPSKKKNTTYAKAIINWRRPTRFSS